MINIHFILQCGILQINSNISKLVVIIVRKLNNLLEPVTKKKEYVTYQTLLKRCENAMCNYPLAFVIVNPVVNLFMYITQLLNTLTKRCFNVVTTFDITHFQYLKQKHILIEYFTYFCIICLIYNDFSRLRTRVISTLPHDIYLVKRCYNVAATFVPNEHTATFQKSTRALTKRCCDVVTTFGITYFQYLKKHIM